MSHLLSRIISQTLFDDAWASPFDLQKSTDTDDWADAASDTFIFRPEADADWPPALYLGPPERWDPRPDDNDNTLDSLAPSFVTPPVVYLGPPDVYIPPSYEESSENPLDSLAPPFFTPPVIYLGPPDVYIPPPTEESSENPLDFLAPPFYARPTDPPINPDPVEIETSDPSLPFLAESLLWT